MNRENLGLGLAVCTIVPAIFQASLPPVAAVRASSDEAGHLAAAERSAAVTAGVFVLAVATVAGSAEVAGLGLAAVLAFSCMYAAARKTPA
jgi:hypothetical protein